MATALEKLLLKKLKVIPDFPKKGIQFQDIFSLVSDPKCQKKIIGKISKYAQNNSITKIAGIEARGFIFGPLVADKLNIPFVPIRKKGKLPGKVIKMKYKLEYGFDQIEMQKGAIKKQDRVLIVDDLIATGGTALASSKLISKMGVKRIFFAFVINLYNLDGAKLIEKNKYPYMSIIDAEG
tara:strand:+ start:286 stop:828 length:543 start_codon:yes stop_codon:yes gene_type:complete